MTEFLNAFWPNLAATVLGVIFGLPVALYVNGRLTTLQRRQEAATQKSRRDDAIDVLINACVYNVKVLGSIKALACKGKVMRNPDLRVTTWGAVGPMFAPICSSPELLQHLSHHWLRLQRLECLNEEIFSREVGTLPPLSDKKCFLACGKNCMIRQ